MKTKQTENEKIIEEVFQEYNPLFSAAAREIAFKNEIELMRKALAKKDEQHQENCPFSIINTANADKAKAEGISQERARWEEKIDKVIDIWTSGMTGYDRHEDYYIFHPDDIKKLKKLLTSEVDGE